MEIRKAINSSVKLSLKDQIRLVDELIENNSEANVKHYILERQSIENEIEKINDTTIHDKTT